MKDRLIQMVLFARKDGKRKQGEPARRWTYDFTEWSGENVWMAKREVEQRMGSWAKK
jgi:hypothetical protein